jgi:dimethylhistidine N-methyltransferase
MLRINDADEEIASRTDALPIMLSAGDASSRCPFRFLDLKPRQARFRDAVLAGLAATPKRLEPKFFYDENGSRLFEQICGLPEYYPTRTEIAVLDNYAKDIRDAVGRNALLIEFGSGSSRKIRCLLDHLEPSGYVAIEISREQLLEACAELSDLYPDLPILAICADYSQPLRWEGMDGDAAQRKLAFFPGSTIGNFMPEEAVAFLANVRGLVGSGGGMLIGVDMKKDKERLHAAYNDSDGVTAAFNINLLHRINRELDGDFDVARFRHHAFYNEAQGRVEMHLMSLRAQQVCIGGQVFSFKEGETIHTENSYKYTQAEFRALAARAGFVTGEIWQDDEGLFSVFHLTAE